ncbi:hypothetical protein LXL04_015295 [Taraxacum kok-saghyz]
MTFGARGDSPTRPGPRAGPASISGMILRSQLLLAMLSIVESPWSSAIIVAAECDSESSSNPIDVVLFAGISLLLGSGLRHLFRGTRVPYTVALLVLGIAIGSLGLCKFVIMRFCLGWFRLIYFVIKLNLYAAEYGTSHGLGNVDDGIRIWANIDPDILLAVFLPPLLFESAFSMDVHLIKKCMAQMILLAGPGILISTFILGSALKLIFPYNWSWITSLLLRGLLSATDPVAVLASLKELGASKKLTTLIEGESLMNDGLGIVLYTLFFRMLTGSSFSYGSVIKFLATVSLGAVGMGITFGLVSYLWLGFVFNNRVIEITMTLSMSYLSYFTISVDCNVGPKHVLLQFWSLFEFISQEGADISGVLTVMTLGMFYAAVGRTAFNSEGQESLHHFWYFVAFY